MKFTVDVFINVVAIVVGIASIVSTVIGNINIIIIDIIIINTIVITIIDVNMCSNTRSHEHLRSVYVHTSAHSNTLFLIIITLTRHDSSL